MSAYVVEDETINRIIGWLEQDSVSTRWRVATYILKEHGYNLDLMQRQNGDAKQLAEDMFALNVTAVNQRYGPGEAAKFRPLDFKYISRLAPTTPRVLKSLQCWLYQCSEGDVPESDLYKMFREIEFAICRELVERIPEYAEADWS